MGKIVVTGAAGFIGSHTVESLLADGHEVCGIDNLRTGHRSNLDGVRDNERFSFEEIDLLQAGALDAVVERFQPSGIVHLAALVSVQESMDDPALNFSLNLEVVHRVGDVARRAGVKQLVFASSAAIYGDTEALPVTEETAKNAISPYGAAKYAGEAVLQGYARSYGFGACCFRYFNVYGPRQDPRSPYSGVMSIFSDRYRRGEAVTIFGDGLQTRDFIYVKDVARFNAYAATSPSPITGSYNVCTGRASTLLDVVSVFQKHFPDVGKPKFQEARKGDILRSYGDPSRLKADLALAADVRIEEGLSALIQSLA